MVEYNPDQLDHIFRALSDPTRRGMLHRLSADELSVGELAAPCDMSLAAASKHIRMLENAGLVTRTVTGRKHVFRLSPGALARAHQWLSFYERFWNARLDSLQQILEQEENDE